MMSRDGILGGQEAVVASSATSGRGVKAHPEHDAHRVDLPLLSIVLIHCEDAGHQPAVVQLALELGLS